MTRAGAAAPAFTRPGAPDGIDPGSTVPGRYARVIVDVDPRPGPFDYLVGDLPLVVGSLVRVPLGGRRVRGMVIGFPAEPGSTALRPVIAALGSGPAADPVLLALARWAAWYHLTPLPVVLRRVVGDRLPGRWTPPVGRGPGYEVVLADRPPAPPALEVHPHHHGRAVVWSRQTAHLPIAVHEPLDPAHRETAMPTFHSLAVADARARLDQVPLFVVGRMPGAEARRLARREERSPADQRRRSWPLVEVVDRSLEPPTGGGLASRTARVVRETVEQGRQVFVFLNRVGTARALRCRGCGRLRRCASCGAALGRDAQGVLACRRCWAPPSTTCELCDSAPTRPVGRGTAGLVNELATLIPGAAIARIDREAQAPVAPAPIVVGTQAAFSIGLRPWLVVVADADSLELAPRYGAAEEALWLMATASRLAGPRSGPGRALVQTYRPQSAVVQALVRGDSSRLDEQEADVRAGAGLPPFGDVIVVTGPDSVLDPVATELAGAPIHGDPGSLVLAAPDLDPWRGPLRDAIVRHRRAGQRIRVEIDPPG